MGESALELLESDARISIEYISILGFLGPSFGLWKLWLHHWIELIDLYLEQALELLKQVSERISFEITRIGC